MTRRAIVLALFCAACSSSPVEVEVGLLDGGLGGDAEVFSDAQTFPDALGYDDADVEISDADIFPDADDLPDSEVADAGEDAGLEDAGGPRVPVFVPHTIDSTIAGGASLAVIDLDNDTDLDIVVTATLSEEVIVYENLGAGMMFAKTPIGSQIVAVDVTAADLDGDLDLDVAAAGLYEANAPPDTTPGEIVWYENPGAIGGAWIAHPITGPTIWGARSLRAADLTGDGLEDLVAGCIEAYDINGDTHGQGVYWFRNEGGGVFSSAITVDQGITQVETVILSDVGGNGVVDIIASSTGDDEVVIFENDRAVGVPTATITFTRDQVTTREHPFGIASANVDGDPARELFVAYTGGNGDGAIGMFDPPLWSERVLDVGFGADTTRLHTDDLDGDLRVDLAASSLQLGLVNIYYGDGTSTTAATIEAASYIAGGDIDGDNWSDLVVTTFRGFGFDSLIWLENTP